MADDGTALSLDRTVYFSDAVFAIALTLLAIDLPIPSGSTDQEVWRSFTSHVGDDYFPFALSFVVIGLLWMQHHRFFQRVAAASRALLVVNLAGLLVIVAVPFVTKFLGEAEHDVGLGVVFYATALTMWAVAFVLMVGAVDRGGLWRPGVTRRDVRRMVAGSSSALAPFALSIPVAFVDPNLAPYLWLLGIPAGIVTGRQLR
jgi:TMEM175 potassium channel family protein